MESLKKLRVCGKSLVDQDNRPMARMDSEADADEVLRIFNLLPHTNRTKSALDNVIDEFTREYDV